MGASPLEDSLSVELFYDLYRGALDIDDESERLAAAHVILSGGRLGLRPGELLHLHEGWVDWRRGELTVPPRDPCACRHCWETARQRAGEGSVAAVVRETCWSPESGGVRTIPFGWSQRLTAVLMTVFDRFQYLDRSPAALRSLLRRAAANSEAVDGDDLTLTTLRNTAGRFLAEAGLDVDVVADTLGVETAEAREFVRAAGTVSTDEIYGALGSGRAGRFPDDAGTSFPIVRDPTRFDGEPFAPATHDAATRAERATDRTDERRVLRSPRPTVVPDGIEFDPASIDLPEHHDPASDRIVPRPGERLPAISTMPAWMREREEHRGLEEPASDDEAGDSSEDLGMRSAIVEECAARFATTDGPGRPTEGYCLLGTEELLLVDERAKRERERRERIPLGDVFDVSLEYVPTGMEGSFEDPLSVAFSEGSDKKIAIIEPTNEDRRGFATALYETLLRGRTVTVRHPARIGGRVTDEPARVVELHPSTPRLSFRNGETSFDVPLEAIYHVETTRREMAGERREVVSISHESDGVSQTTEVGIQDSRVSKLLRRYVRVEYDEKRRSVKHVELSEDEKEVLVGLYSTGGTDLDRILTKEASVLTDLLASLEEKGLISRQGGVELTDAGEVLLAERLSDANA